MSFKLALNPGHHLPEDPGAVANGIKEAEPNIAICNGIAKHLVAYDVLPTIIYENDLDLICSKANDLKADYFLSIHCNAGGGTGFESYCYISASNATENLRRVIHAETMGYLLKQGVEDRGTKVANFAVLRDTNMPAALLECLFVDNVQDAAKLKDAAFIDGLCNAIAWGLVEALGLVKKVAEPTSGTPATGLPVATLEQAREFLRQRAPDWVMMADLYYSIAKKYNIRADVALAQACKETAFFRFGGAVTPDMNNFCGLKVITASGDTPADHATFADKASGVEAHIQHMAAYFTTDVIPALIDPRFDIVVKTHGRGKLKYVEELGGKWAPNPDYGASIVRDYLNKMLATVAPTEAVPAVSPPTPCANCAKLEQVITKIRELVAP